MRGTHLFQLATTIKAAKACCAAIDGGVYKLLQSAPFGIGRQMPSIGTNTLPLGICVEVKMIAKIIS